MSKPEVSTKTRLAIIKEIKLHYQISADLAAAWDEAISLLARIERIEWRASEHTFTKIAERHGVARNYVSTTKQRFHERAHTRKTAKGS